MKTKTDSGKYCWYQEMKKMSDQLFTEVSVEQQETVTGGNIFDQFWSTANGASTSFQGTEFVSGVNATSGPTGSTAGGGFSLVTVITTGTTFNGTAVTPPPPPPPPPGPGPGPGPLPV